MVPIAVRVVGLIVTLCVPVIVKVGELSQVPAVVAVGVPPSFLPHNVAPLVEVVVVTVCGGAPLDGEKDGVATWDSPPPISG